MDGLETFIFEVLNVSDLNNQHSIHIQVDNEKSNGVACMAPPFDMNPLTNMWCLVNILNTCL